MKVIVAICGSIAAYKTLELIRLLKKEGAEVKVILTKSALHFVTPLSCQTLSENEVLVDQFVLTKGIKHLTLSQWADILVIAPATANIIGKAASGIGDDLLSTTILSFEKPILFVPAMDTEMWENIIVQRNAKLLEEVGSHILEPTTGFLASGKIGRGRFPHTSLIFKKIMAVVEGYKSLRSKKFLISGGRTEEDIDSLRVITNRSTGIMARELLYAVASRSGQARGIFGEATICLPEGMEIKRARTSEEMLQELRHNITWCDCLIMAAAVGDYRPKSKSSQKIHDTQLRLELKKNRDLLKELRKKKGKRVMVGFSLEDTKQLEQGKKKLVSKGLDFIVLNSAGAVASDMVDAKILEKSGKLIEVGLRSKWQLANRILDQCIQELNRKK